MLAIKETIQFGNLNTKDYGLYLTDRQADTPEEDEQVEQIPYRSGQEDFGFLTGERIFKQRTIKYTFLYPTHEYDERKRVENDLKRDFMPLFDERLVDSHDNGFYWIGKCSKISVKDNTEKGTLTVDMEFSLYPFAFKDTSDDTIDYWDGFDFERDILQPLTYVVNGSRTIKLYNNGTNSITPIIKADGDYTLTVNGTDYKFSTTKTQDYWLKLGQGETIVTINGNGTIMIVLRQEVML